MVKEKKTRFVILGFLLKDSLTGYELGEMIKQSTNNFWKESDASIYPTLKLLAKEELVISEIVQMGRRRKEIFTITSLGKAAFLEWFKRSPDLDWHREEFLLKLFFTDESTQQQMERHSYERMQKLKLLHEKYKKAEEFLKEQLPKRSYWLKTLQIGIAHLELDISLLQKHCSGTYVENNH